MTPRAEDRLRLAADRLAAAGIDEPRREARLLLAAALGVDRSALIADPDRPLDAESAARFDSYVDRRAGREPVSRILGRRGFWSGELRVTPDVLDPRADTETLVEATLATLADRTAPVRLLDLGTGSGCILSALLGELPHAFAVGIDRSAAAALVARDNLAQAGHAARARILVGDWAESLRGPFERILSNPPYIPSREIAGLDPEVACHDPRAALDGGADGLDCYRRIAEQLGGLLAPGGIALFEIGAEQAESVSDIMRDAGFSSRRLIRDLAGKPRVVAVCRGETDKHAEKAWNGVGESLR